jgi:hypothetical protein
MEDSFGGSKSEVQILSGEDDEAQDYYSIDPADFLVHRDKQFFDSPADKAEHILKKVNNILMRSRPKA